MIKLYGFESCGPCKQIKRLLDKFGIEYKYIDVLKKKLHFVSVPILELEDGTQIIGLGKTMTDYIKKLGKNYRKKL
jgi:arsenate reductase-like glutaredoxin family protein